MPQLPFLILLCLISGTALSKVDESIPLKGKILNFSDPYGPYEYDSEIIHYESKDGAKIEATLITSKINMKRPGLIFVHMWARDRMTFWGLPEYLATFGYSSIYMDLRGHGNSFLPNSKEKISIKDKRKKYENFYLDIIPAITRIHEHKGVKKNHLILIGASLGCPLGVMAMEQEPEKFMGMIHLAPATIYFDVNCKFSLKKLSHIPMYAVIEKTDRSFRNAMHFTSFSQLYKNVLIFENVGHGTDVLYKDLELPTIILNWIQQIELFHPILNKLSKHKKDS